MTSKRIAFHHCRHCRSGSLISRRERDMQNPIHLHHPARIASLRLHYGDSETTLVMGEVPIAWSAGQREGIRVSDLLIAFNVDLAGIIDKRGYAIEREGTPPDFALEVASPTTRMTDYTASSSSVMPPPAQSPAASPTTRMTDYTAKRGDYEAYGISEYWRFDASGGLCHDVALAGGSLVDGSYHPIAVEWTDDTHCRGYSQALGVHICWEDGRLRWYDPESGGYLRTFDEASAALQAAAAA